jgi:poly-gamma-glutamate synthesis protein (capsule biosynthesis protein)
MKNNRWLSLALICSLVLQLITLNPQFSLPEYSFGNTESFVAAETVLLPKTVYEVALASKQVETKDVVVFTGDVMLARNVEFLMTENSPQFPYEKISLKDLGESPAIVGNFEAAMPQAHQVVPPLAMRFSVHPQYLDALRGAGFTHVSLANNHSFDFGNDGYFNAITLLESERLKSFGSGRDVSKNSIAYLETNIGNLAIIGINASDRIPDFNDVHLVMKRARRNSDHQVIYIHWGTEYETTHSRVQEVIAKALIKEGADLIIGHHPHVTQDIVIIDGVVVVYSLGNFIFDQYFDEEVMRGLVVSLDAQEETILNLLPITSEEHLSQPSFMEGEERDGFLAELASQSDDELKQAIFKGQIPLSNMVATSPKKAIILR